MRRDHEGAEKMYKRALNLDPQNVNTLCNYGIIIIVICCVVQSATCMYVYKSTHTHTHNIIMIVLCVGSTER